MNKKAKSIRLHRETLRALDPALLSQAAAALDFSLAPCNTNTTPVTRCGDGCVTYSCGVDKCD
jgi:hypothetical protein